MLLRHEALKRVKTLLKGSYLAWRQVLLLELASKGSVVECSVILLLGDSQVTQDTRHDVQVERHAASLGRAGSHEVEHTLGDEVRLVEAQLLDDNARKGAVEFLLTVLSARFQVEI